MSIGAVRSSERRRTGILVATALGLALGGCGEEPPLPRPTAATGGLEGTATGGAAAAEPPASGGLDATGGATQPGGAASGGLDATGGDGTGGLPGTGGLGGAPASGGVLAGGAAAATGGTPAGGALPGSGGATTGGEPASGGQAGAPPAAGASAGGAAGSDGAGGAPLPVCPAPACADAPEQERVCADGDGLALGKYRLLNNLWGGGASVESDGQCSFRYCADAAVAWGTEFTWTSGDPVGVKSFTAAILGWHWSGIDAASGLPIQLSAGHRVPCRWSFEVDVDPGGSLNVAYDLWVHSSADVNEWTSPTDEVMIWEYAYQKDDPIGTYQATLNVGGADWDLYEGPNEFGNQVHSFLRQPYVTCDEIDLADFLDALVTRGTLDPSKYLISIEAGPEVVMGQGSVITRTYGCDVQ